MLKTLKLGNKTFPINIIQGPLAGISCSPFRLLTYRHSQPAFTYTEMISCKTLIHQNRTKLKRFVEKNPQEGPVCFQLSGSSPLEVAEATKIATDYGADLIDLNCGCPVKKIRSKGAGSSLLTHSAMLYQLMCSMKLNTHLPVSIKIRVENAHEKFNSDIVKVVTEAGIDFIVVHGRHWTEHYETSCRYDEIKYFVDELKIPVIGNGDIACPHSLKKMFDTGCSGVMVARASVGRPWLIKNLISSHHGEELLTPSLSEVGSLFFEHVTLLSELLQNEKFAILQARKFSKYYGRMLENKNAFCVEVNACENLKDLKMICSKYFGAIAMPYCHLSQIK